ncbi:MULTISPECIES: SDR family NAD(P)-dependent oxidoreductase [Ramlibacter]|uniref:SDR family NAD(P)-dependent oxidoreductase n=1 Tax=Ramlibacter aquaticus TaxID=2780094 RepID=A0ABR9SJC2_9BURK|nr:MULTISPECIES: SDR family NAD(P)-dependent oxidoreductase [Ramlibacter]MBE7942466.1 SDR family NAD(P)-dependent oxidoreductase [Ramlibacter aquaticus]
MAARNSWLRGGVALVTGAASGIGAALAQSLARRGMDLALADRNADGLAATAQAVSGVGVRSSVHRIDLADRAAIAALPAQVLDSHGRLNVLVNNAGVAVGGSFLQVDESDFDRLMAVNFEAVVRLTRAFLPVLQKEPAAQLVNISSIFGIVAPPGQTAYCASKFAVRGFSESLRHELAVAGSPVGVTVVHPGGVRTAIAENATPPRDVTPELLARQKQVWERMLKMPAAEAGEIVARGIEQRALRVLVGDDARQAAFLQRLFPVGYWRFMAAEIRRRTGGVGV